MTDQAITTLGTYYGLTVPHQMWRGLGLLVQPYGNYARVTAEYSFNNPDGIRAPRAIELLERAKATAGPSATDEQVVRAAIVLRGEDRFADGLAALGRGLAQMPRDYQVHVAHRIAGAVTLALTEGE